MTLYDLSIKLIKETTKDEVNQVVQKEIDSNYKIILEYTQALQSSNDYIEDPHSAVVNLSLTSVSDGNLLRISAWQDNEYGYAKRLVNMVTAIA
jgi:glyceraldehyde 3-phosphate dehydrogenase